MNIASIFDWFAQDSRYAAAHADEPRQQDMWMKLAEQLRYEPSRQAETAPTKCLARHRIDLRGRRSRAHSESRERQGR